MSDKMGFSFSNSILTLFSDYDKQDSNTVDYINNCWYMPHSRITKKEALDYLSSKEYEQELLKLHSFLEVETGFDESRFLQSKGSASLYLQYMASNNINLSLSDILEIGFRQAYSIIKNHPFIDGNKRTGVHAGLYLVSRFTGANVHLSNIQQEYLAGAFIKELEKCISLEELNFIWKSIVGVGLIQSIIPLN